MSLWPVQLQCLLGVACKDFVMIAADMTATQSIFIMKNDEDKIFKLSDHLMMGMNADGGDMNQFSQYISSNVQLYRVRNGYELDAGALANFTRRTLEEGLRSGNPCLVNLVIGGYDEKNGGQLYTIDFFSSCQKVPFTTHGFGGNLSVGILNEYYRPNMSETEALDLLKLCITRVQRRLIISLPTFLVKVVSALGIRQLPVITAKNLVPTE